MSSNRTTTVNSEFVETGNIYLSITRLQNQCNEDGARRAIYHAACRSCLMSEADRTAIRIALKLP